MYKRERISTTDNDFLDLDWLQNDYRRLVILSHGLEGDSTRPYIKGMARIFFNHGWDCLAWNFRGCSGEINRQLRFYHSGATEDLDFVINYALKKYRYEEIALIGFSLGGNLTLKFLGEKAKDLYPEVKSATVFSVPLDLYTSCLKLTQLSNRIYSRRFINNLKAKVSAKVAVLPGKLSTEHFKNIKELLDFDDLYTAPIHGFKNALHYYQSCSSINFLQNIQIPTLIVNAQNDPFLSKECFPFELIKENKHVFFEAPKNGGHCGFTLVNKENYYWSELRALEFIRY